jgi:hypothetical protein
MKLNINLLFSALLGCLLICSSMSSCKSDKATDDTPITADNLVMPQEEDISQDFNMPKNMDQTGRINAWTGSYYGILPCNGCLGTEILITLEFSGRAHYSTKEYGNEADSGETAVGRCQWDEDGKIVRVRDYNGDWHQFAYEVDKLVKLDPDGKKYTGPSASAYILNKVEDKF